MNLPHTATVRLLSRMLPARDREVILADLWEESTHRPRRHSWIAAQTVRMAAHLHLECYRDPRDAGKLIALLLASACLVLAIRAFGFGPDDGARYFTDPITRGILAFWSASHLTSSIATGLILGRIALPAHLSIARWHAVAAIGLLLVLLYAPSAAATGVATLLTVASIANRARPDSEHATDEPTSAST